MSRPNFFIVGAPKCATTAIHSYLSRHPDIFMAQKELHHFATDLILPGDPRADRDFYLRFFAEAGGARVRGDSSVFHLLSHTAAEQIHAFDPEAKILILVRNPVDVLASHHSQVVYEGLENITELAAALEAEPDRRQGRRLPSVLDPKRMLRLEAILAYREVVAFAAQIERFLARFPRKQIHVAVFDDFVRGPDAVYRAILEFLEVDPTFRVPFVPVNENKRIRSRHLRRLHLDPPQWSAMIARAVLTPDARSRVKQFFKDVNTRFEQRRPMDPALRRTLLDELAPEIERLGIVIERDLNHWLET